MTLEVLLEKLDQLVGLPGALAKTRELIFQLAIGGRLSSQNEKDGTGTDVLTAVFREKKMYKGKPSVLPEQTLANDSAHPFPIPANWIWCSLATVALQIQYGYTASADHSSTEIRLLRITDIQNGRVNWSSVPGCEITPYEAEKYFLKRNDILIARTGGTIGKSFIVSDAPVKSVFASYLIRVTLPQAIDAKYVKIFLESPFYWKQLHTMSAGTGQPNVNGQALGRLTFPIPPLAEQKRIVARVDDLMALCDRLEVQFAEQEAKQIALSNAAITRFSEAPTPANFSLLFNRAYSICSADIRKIVINLAVQGKLTVQNPADEPASDLVLRIEKARSVVRARSYPAVEPSDAPFEIPVSWTWSRLGNIALSSDSGWSPQCDPQPREGDGWGVLKVSSVSWGEFLPEENKALPSELRAREECEVKTGDFLLSRANTEDLVARSVVVGEAPRHLMMSDKIVRFTFPDMIDKAFINLVNSARFAREYYSRNASGTSSSMKNIGREVMSNLPIPLPPLDEQRRIVVKTESLLTMLDRMEEMTETSRVMASGLVDAIVTKLLASGGA